MILRDIVLEHAEECAFLWLRRRAAVKPSNFTLAALSDLDERIEAHLDGLRVAGDPGWEICVEGLSQEEPGEVFAAAVLAFESGDDERIHTVLEAGLAKLELTRAVVSALGWLPHELVEGHIRNLLVSELPIVRRVGIAASAIHRRDPGTSLAEALRDDNPHLRARALQAAGELGRTDLIPVVSRDRESGNDACRFAAAWSLALLGEPAAADGLWTFVESQEAIAEEAVSIAIRRADPSKAIQWHRALVENPQTHRLAAIGAGASGDPVLVPWLLKQMNAPHLARVAGEAFMMITGADFAYEDLEGEQPVGFKAGPTEIPEDENVEMDPDENLPWPDADRVRDWWGKNDGRFRNGTRYLLGEPISPGHLDHVLRTGRQGQRVAAALELAMAQPGRTLFEVRAPGFRQKQILGVK